MGEWLVLLYFSVQMLHVVMVLKVVVGLFLYDFDCVFGVWGVGCVWLWCLGCGYF